ncbi:MAG: tRNA (guanosine(46)-N7)-methyltransferase TrmB [Proteobacteria bacterium]|nr:tRNA (guanosine(46)-N7)-methyltransferase TrmB [Pseudomonadota bacterium]MDE3207418.1 tRNA (guanosine(46)-N7)-methyltransferase TrmB [Pseudomonadota bacterium]
MKSDPVHSSPTRPIRSFVLRQGRLSDAQARALKELSPEWGIPFSRNPIHFPDVFGNSEPVILEIGSGMGETTAQIARQDPQHNFLAIEVHGPGVGSLLRRIHEDHIPNIRLIQHDAVEVIEHMIVPNSLAGIHIYFPDPWPKKRHHKRRLIQAGFVTELTSRIQPGGYIHVATDWQDYAEHILAVLSSSPRLINSSSTFATRPAWRPQTKFEHRGLKLGHGVWDILFHKRADSIID